MRLAASVGHGLSTIDGGTNGDLPRHHLLLTLTTNDSADFLFSQVTEPGAILPMLVYRDLLKMQMRWASFGRSG